MALRSTTSHVGGLPSRSHFSFNRRHSAINHYYADGAADNGPAQLTGPRFRVLDAATGPELSVEPRRRSVVEDMLAEMSERRITEANHRGESPRSDYLSIGSNRTRTRHGHRRRPLSDVVITAPR